MNDHYNKDLREYAHELRTETVSRAEKYLWKAALSKNKLGVKFKRQRPLHRFIVDFFCSELRLVIEIDGNSHMHKAAYDAYRQQKIESLGYTVVRFSEGTVLQDIDSVITKLQHVVYCLKQETQGSQ